MTRCISRLDDVGDGDGDGAGDCVCEGGGDGDGYGEGDGDDDGDGGDKADAGYKASRRADTALLYFSRCTDLSCAPSAMKP